MKIGPKSVPLLLTVLTVSVALGQQDLRESASDSTLYRPDSVIPTKMVTTIVLESSNLPIMVIDADSQTIPSCEPRLVVDVGIIYNGEGIRNYIDDPFNNYDGKVSIERRGQSSTRYPKKQYAFETQDESGENLSVSLIGLPIENDWILHAPYSDKTLMRNVLAYKLATDMGWYASRTRFCELVLDGDYRGVYVLMEEIKRDRNRLDIAVLEPDEISGDDLTGGYIVKIDKFDEQDSVWASAYPTHLPAARRIHFQYWYPSKSDIVAQQKQYIQTFIYEFETRMWGPAYTDPTEGYLPCVDIDSFVDFFIINEVAKNIDGFRLSTFIYKDRDSRAGRLTMGPIWDFNFAFGNVSYREGFTTDGWLVEVLSEYGNGKYEIPFWWEKLVWDKSFVDQVNERWQQLRNWILDLERLDGYVDSVADSLEEAPARNFLRWPILGRKIWPNYFMGHTYQEEVDYLKDWLRRRIQWIDRNIAVLGTDVVWRNPNRTHFGGVVGVEETLPLDALVQSSVNVDSIVFHSAYPSLQVVQDKDTIRLNSSTNGRFGFYGIAWSRDDTASMSSSYSYKSLVSPVIWADPDLIQLTGSTDVRVDVLVAEFVLDSVTVDSITFSCPSQNLQIVQNGDTLSLTAFVDDVFEFCGTAWRDGDTTSISPVYTYRSGGADVSCSPHSGPREFALFQNYPNPFSTEGGSLPIRQTGAARGNPITSIQYDVANPAHVSLAIYDVLGRHIRTLVARRQQAGHYQTDWDGTDECGQPVAAGVYCCRMEAGNSVKVIKLALLR